MQITMFRNIHKLLDNTNFQIFATAIVIAIGLILRGIVGRIINNRVQQLTSKYLWRQTANYIITIIGLIALLTIWFNDIKSFFQLITLVSATLILVSKELILNFVAYMVIVWRGLFEVGDRIEVGDKVIGDVMEFGPLYISVSEIGNWMSDDSPTGRMIKIPNSLALTQQIANYSKGLGLIWNEIEISISKDSDLVKAKEIADGIALKYSYQFSEKDKSEIKSHYQDLLFPTHDPNVMINLDEYKYKIIIHYICKFFKRRESESSIKQDLITRFNSEENIEIYFKS